MLLQKARSVLSLDTGTEIAFPCHNSWQELDKLARIDAENMLLLVFEILSLHSGRVEVVFAHSDGLPPVALRPEEDREVYVLNQRFV